MTRDDAAERFPFHRCGQSRVESDALLQTGPVTSPVATHLSTRKSVLLVGAMVALDLVLVSGMGQPGPFVLWWSSVGLGVGLLALSPPRRWPVLVALVIGASYVSAAVGGSFAMHATTVVALSHGAQALLGALIVTRGGRYPGRLLALSDLGFVVAAGLTSGVVAASTEFAFTPGPESDFVGLALDLFAQHAVSTVLLAALVLALGQGVRERTSLGELAVQSIATVAVTAGVFVPLQGDPFAVAPIPFLVWAALRFDIKVVTVEVVVFAAGVTFATSQGRGPFALLNGPRYDEADVGTITLIYVLCAALVTLLLSLIVSQRRQLLEQVSRDERRFRRNFTESPLGMVFLHEIDGHLVIDDLNSSACSILRTESSAVIGRSLLEIVTPLDQMHRELARLMHGEIDAWHGPASALSRPGSRLEMAVSMIDTSVSPHIYSAQLLDVTQEHDAHRRLEAALRFTDATLDTTACVIMVTDSTGAIVRINAATEEITGYGTAELLGLPIWESPLPVLSRTETEAMFMWPNRSGYAIVREHATRAANGEPMRLVWNSNVVHDDMGFPTYSVLTGIDVTAERNSTGLTAHLLKAPITTALIGVDAVGRITVFNVGAAKMLGHPSQDMLGRSFTDIFDPAQLLARTGAASDHEAFLRLVAMIDRREESVARDWTWRASDGHDLTVSMTLSVTDDEVEDQVGFLCVGRDVTEQREAQDTLIVALAKERTAVERLRLLDQAKDEFVSTVSHELRTPVTSILGFTEMLRDGSIVEPIPEQLNMLDTIARNGRRLIEICNDLLMLSGFESQAMPHSRRPIDLRESLNLTEESAQALIGARSIDIKFDVASQPLEVLGDRDQLDRVVTNLVSNAIKFTADGGSVRVRAARTPDGIELTVTDTGIGIAADEHEAVFQRFYRTENAQSMAIPGTGLGLPIVAGIVAAHGGAITIDSAPGEGTTFTVLLPAT